jgi:hypothetical protein
MSRKSRYSKAIHQSKPSGVRSYVKPAVKDEPSMKTNLDTTGDAGFLSTLLSFITNWF